MKTRFNIMPLNIFKRMGFILSFLNGEDGSISKKTIRSLSWVGITGILMNILVLIKGIILARILTPEIFGLMSICLIVIRGFEIFTETGFYTALIQRQKDPEEAKDTAFTMMVLRGFILAFITVLISPCVADYYNEKILSNALKVIAISFIFSGFVNVNTVSLQRELNFKKLAYLEQIHGILNFIIVIVLAYYFRNVWALVLGHVISHLLGSILSFVMIPGRPRIRLDTKIAKELFQYGKFITGVTIVVFITTEIDNLMVGKILGMEKLGYYVLAYTLANLPATHISKVISRVLFPAYSALQDKRLALQDAFLRTLKLVSYITIPAAAGLAVLAPEIVRVVYGDKWTPAASSLAILSLFGCVRSLGAIQGYLYNAIGKPNISFYLNMAKLIVIVGIIIPLTRKYELTGACFAVTAPAVVSYVVSLYILRKVIVISLGKVVNILFATILYSVIMGLVVFLVKIGIPLVNGGELVFLVILGNVVYFILTRREILSNVQGLKYQLTGVPPP